MEFEHWHAVPAINQHLKRLFSDNVLDPEATIKQYLIAAACGQNLPDEALQPASDHRRGLQDRERVRRPEASRRRFGILRSWASSISRDNFGRHSRHLRGLERLQKV